MPSNSLAAWWAWALPSAGKEAMFWLVAIYLLKYSSDVLGVGPAVVGGIFALGRLWDAVSDPLVGFWSDRTRSRFGRRRPFMLAAALPLALGFYGVWNPPAALSGIWLIGWLGVALWVMYTAATLLAVPHASLGAELSEDHHTRTRIFGVRALCEFGGILGAIAGLAALENAVVPRDTAHHVALALGGFTLLATLVCVLRVSEPPEHSGRGGMLPLRAFGDVWRNEHARVLLAAFFLTDFALSALATLVPYISGQMTGGEGRSGLLMLAFIGPAVLAVPFWGWLSRRIGKRESWCLALVALSVSFGCFAMLDGRVGPAAFVVVLIVGVSQGATRMLPHSIKADIIDVDELRTGERKEGAYFAAWNLVQKLAGAAAIFCMGFVIELAGFREGVNADNAWKLMLVAAAFPAVLTGLAAFLVSRLRLDERAHAQVQSELRGEPPRIALREVEA